MPKFDFKCDKCEHVMLDVIKASFVKPNPPCEKCGEDSLKTYWQQGKTSFQTQGKGGGWTGSNTF